MKVIKRDGRIQDFEIRKVILTLEKASDEAGTPLTSSDIHNLSRAISAKILNNGKDRIQVEGIQDIVLSQLREDGFSNVAQYYEKYSRNLYEK